MRAVEAHYAQRQAEAVEDTLSRRIGTALRKERKLLDRKFAKLEGELAAAERDSLLERQGNLLKTTLSELKKGDSAAIVEDWETGETLRIPLDPQLAPAENLARLFKRYRKAIRTLTRGGAQRESVREALREIETLEASFEAASGLGVEALEKLAAEVGLARLLAKYAPAPAAKAGKTKRAKSPRSNQPLDMHDIGRSVRSLLPRRRANGASVFIFECLQSTGAALQISP